MASNTPLERIDSNDTLLNTLADDSDVASLLTFNSNETLTNTIFNSSIPISSYSLRTLPIVSSLLSSDVHVFQNDSEVDSYIKDAKSVFPILSTSLSILNYFKINSPFLIVNRHTSITEKSQFCKVYFKVLHKELSCYILVFQLQHHKKVCLLLNNELKPYVDCVWEDTKLRILGTSGTTSTFANGFIKVFILENNYNTLTDNVEVTYDPSQLNSVKDVKISLPKDNELMTNLFSHNKSYISRNLSGTRTFLGVPIASFMDGNSKSKKFVKNGYLRLFDNGDNLSENGLVIASILLALRELEIRKNKGNNKPTFTR